MATAEAHPRTFHAPAARRDDAAVRTDGEAFLADGPLAAVLDAIPSLILVLDAQRQVIFANAAAQRVATTWGTTPVLGRRPGEVLACRNVADAPSGCGTGAACRTCGAVNTLLEALHGRPATDECRIGTRRGDALDLRATATPFRWRGREYALMVLDDVSDAKRRAVLERTFFHDQPGDPRHAARGVQEVVEERALEHRGRRVGDRRADRGGPGGGPVRKRPGRMDVEI